jgi:hypothetical protein
MVKSVIECGDDLVTHSDLVRPARISQEQENEKPPDHSGVFDAWNPATKKS